MAPPARASREPGGATRLSQEEDPRVERTEIEAELIVVRALIEEMIERRPTPGFVASDERDYEQLVARETILLELHQSRDQ